MAQFASDTFTGTAGTELSAYNTAWALHPSYSIDYLISADGRAYRNGVGVTSAYYHSGTPASADYEVSADLFAKEANGGATAVGVTGRMSTSANTFYHSRYWGGVPGWQLFKAVAGTFTQLGSSVTQSLTDETSHAIKLKMVGTAPGTIELFKEGEGTAAISVPDTAITAAGKAGIRGNQTESTSLGLHIDNFSADDIGGGPTYTLPITTGSLTLTGNTTSFSSHRKLLSSLGTFSLTGTPITFQAGRVLPVVAATFTLTGNTTTLTYTPLSGPTYTLALAPGGFIVTGVSTNFVAHRKTNTTVGAFTLTGNPVVFKADRVLPTTPGAYSLTGNITGLTYTPLSGPTYTLALSAGGFVVTGIANSLAAQRKINPEVGTLVLTGTDTGFVYSGGFLPLTNMQMQQLYTWIEALNNNALTVGKFIALK